MFSEASPHIPTRAWCKGKREEFFALSPMLLGDARANAASAIDAATVPSLQYKEATWDKDR